MSLEHKEQPRNSRLGAERRFLYKLAQATLWLLRLLLLSLLLKESLAPVSLQLLPIYVYPPVRSHLPTYPVCMCLYLSSPCLPAETANRNRSHGIDG